LRMGRVVVVVLVVLVVVLVVVVGRSEVVQGRWRHGWITAG
jgi:hypothetical protein